MTEGMLTAACLVDGGAAENAVCAASSHFCTAERQFRTPLELGTQRPPSAQWTATAAGAVMLKKDTNADVFITGATIGRVIDMKIKDALGRPWQLGTVQFDFNLPERFDLTYVGSDGKDHRPYMVHRALLGSIERFFGILIEHYAGAFPLWLAPEQVRILPVSDKALEYANKVARELKAAGFRTDVDSSAEKLGAKIREATLAKVPFQVVVGPRDEAAGTVSVRARADGDLGAMELGKFIELLRSK
jgi:threonyl-tRNA synthetase